MALPRGLHRCSFTTDLSAVAVTRTNPQPRQGHTLLLKVKGLGHLALRPGEEGTRGGTRNLSEKLWRHWTKPWIDKILPSGKSRSKTMANQSWMGRCLTAPTAVTCTKHRQALISNTISDHTLETGNSRPVTQSTEETRQGRTTVWCHKWVTYCYLILPVMGYPVATTGSVRLK